MPVVKYYMKRQVKLAISIPFFLGFLLTASRAGATTISIPLDTTASNGNGFSTMLNISPSDGYDYGYSAVAWDNFYIKRGLLQFNLTSIPADAIITSSTLRIRKSFTSGTGTVNGIIYQLRRVLNLYPSWTYYTQAPNNSWATAGAGNTATDRYNVSLGTWIDTTQAVGTVFSFNIDNSTLQSAVSSGKIGFIIQDTSNDGATDDQRRYNTISFDVAYTIPPPPDVTYAASATAAITSVGVTLLGSFYPSLGFAFGAIAAILIVLWGVMWILRHLRYGLHHR